MSKSCSFVTFLWRTQRCRSLDVHLFFIVYPTKKLNKVRNKTWYNAFKQGIIAKYDVFIAGLRHILLMHNCKKSKRVACRVEFQCYPSRVNLCENLDYLWSSFEFVPSLRQNLGFHTSLKHHFPRWHIHCLILPRNFDWQLEKFRIVSNLG